jgi:hypothetical protein
MSLVFFLMDVTAPVLCKPMAADDTPDVHRWGGSGSRGWWRTGTCPVQGTEKGVLMYVVDAVNETNHAWQLYLIFAARKAFNTLLVRFLAQVLRAITVSPTSKR